MGSDCAALTTGSAGAFISRRMTCVEFGKRELLTFEVELELTSYGPPEISSVVV